MGALRRLASSASGRIAAVCLLVGVAAVIGLLELGHSTSAPAIAPDAPLEVATSFDPSTPEFGDRILARVVVALDTARVEPATLQLVDDLAPLTELGAASTSRSAQGRLELVTTVVAVSCLTDPCIGRNGVERVSLPAVSASVLARNGRVAHASAAWPVLSVRGRVTTSDLNASSPPFEADTAPPPATYRIAPSTLATLLDILAALLALAAIGLAGWQVRLHAGRGRSQGGALERALRLAREAERRPAADRRRALALLGRALERDPRSDAARRLAWSEPAPEPDELEELVTEIEQRGPP